MLEIGRRLFDNGVQQALTLKDPVVTTDQPETKHVSINEKEKTDNFYSQKPRGPLEEINK